MKLFGSELAQRIARTDALRGCSDSTAQLGGSDAPTATRRTELHDHACHRRSPAGRARSSATSSRRAAWGYRETKFETALKAESKEKVETWTSRIRQKRHHFARRCGSSSSRRRQSRRRGDRGRRRWYAAGRRTRNGSRSSECGLDRAGVAEGIRRRQHDDREQFIFNEEMALNKAPRPMHMIIGLGMAGPTLIVHGTEDQKKKYLPGHAQGR